MKIAFLDSQVALWIALGDKRLTPKALAAINRHSKTEISAITIAELEMKAALGRLPIPANLRALFEAAGIEVKAFDALAAEQLSRFPQLNRHDPFDHMILAQASSKFGTTLFTADEAILAIGLDWVVAV